MLCRWGRARTLDELFAIPHWELTEFLRNLDLDQTNESISICQAVRVAWGGDNKAVVEGWNKVRQSAADRMPKLAEADRPEIVVDPTAGRKKLMMMAQMLGGRP